MLLQLITILLQQLQSKIEAMMDQVLEGQQNMSVNINKKLDLSTRSRMRNLKLCTLMSRSWMSKLHILLRL